MRRQQTLRQQRRVDLEGVMDFTKMFVFGLLVLLFLVTPTTSWMLSQLGLNETYHVRHMSMHYARVFLSISVKSNTFPTLIESRWPERYVALRASIFPSVSAHDIAGNGEKRNCRRIQRSIWTQVDGLNRLWVMDIGWQKDATNTFTNSEQICYPKMLVYDLLRSNAEVLRIDCSRYINPSPTDILTIKLGPSSGSRCRTVEKYIYFLRSEDSHILAYDIIEQRWQKRLLVSRKYAQMMPDMLPIKPNDMAFGRRHELLISDADGALFSTSNALLRHDKEERNNVIVKSNNLAKDSQMDNLHPLDLSGYLAMNHLGSLLGPSRGMMVDLMDVLYYVVPKFGAVIRCPNYRQNLTAEGNEIIYMTGKNIQQIFFGSEDSVWLVTDRELQPHDHCFAGLS